MRLKKLYLEHQKSQTKTLKKSRKESKNVVVFLYWGKATSASVL